jgi:hypothetical protein
VERIHVDQNWTHWLAGVNREMDFGFHERWNLNTKRRGKEET